MSRGTGKRKFHHKDIRPKDPNIQRFSEWMGENRNFYAHFRRWMKENSYSASTINIYSVAARQAIGYLRLPYWKINPEDDLQRFWTYLQDRGLTDSSLEGYRKGLNCFRDYLYLRLRKKCPPKQINWDYYLSGLPDWIKEHVCAYHRLCTRGWPPDQVFRNSTYLLSPLTQVLRFIHAREPLAELEQITPEHWFERLDERLREERAVDTVNGELVLLCAFLRYMKAGGYPICERMLLIPTLPKPKRIPKDIPPEQLRILFNEIQQEACSEHKGKSRCGRMDAAWFLLMLFSGMRTGEIRRLKRADIDWERRQIRVEQSKGLKDRMVFIADITMNAMKSYLAVRGPAAYLPEEFFIYRHHALSLTYCYERLKTYNERCGIMVKPHQLRHSCASLLLNSGTPVTSVQVILGHKFIDTTMGYARLYDGTLAADYFRAMNEMERRMALVEPPPTEPPSFGELIALLDSLRNGTLSAEQAGVVQAVRDGILAIARRERIVTDFKVQV